MPYLSRRKPSISIKNEDAEIMKKNMHTFYSYTENYNNFAPQFFEN